MPGITPCVKTLCHSGLERAVRSVALCELLLSGFRLWPSDCGHHRLNAHDVHDPGEIVGEHVECHL